MLEVTYKSNSKQTAIQGSVNGTKFEFVHKISKGKGTNNQKSLEEVVANKFNAYLEKATKNKTLALPKGFESYKKGDPMVIKLIETTVKKAS